MSAHTPGPWFAVDLLEDEGAVIVQDAEGRDLLSTFTAVGVTDDQERANAVLAAAAPDYAAAASETLSAYAELAAEIVGASSTDARWERLAKAIVALDEADKKARGQ